MHKNEEEMQIAKYSNEVEEYVGNSRNGILPIKFDLYGGSDYSRDYAIGRFESDLNLSASVKINPITYRDDYTKSTLPAPTNNFEAYNSTAGVYYRTSKESGYTLVTSEITLNNVSYIDILALGWSTNSYAQAHIEIY